jgi:tetratricopeptide (TPR) repeat protein
MRWSVASGLNQLGYVYRFQGNLASARVALEESLGICREIHDQWGVSVCLTGLGYVALGEGQNETAGKDFREGLRVAIQVPVLQVALEIIAGLAELEARAGRTARALELLGLAFHHPASRRETYLEAEQLLQKLKAQHPAELVEAALRRGGTFEIEAVAAELAPLEKPKDLGFML